MGMSIIAITPRLEHRTTYRETGKFEKWMYDGQPVLRRNKGYEWFNHDLPPTHYECSKTGHFDRIITEQQFRQLLDEYKKAA